MSPSPDLTNFHDEWDTLIRKGGDAPVTHHLFGECLKVVVEFMTAMNGKNMERNGRLDVLEQRITALEARPSGLKYCGTWQNGQTYALNDGVTYAGSIWVAKTDRVKSEPGNDPVCWQLAVKRGRDAR